MTSIAFVEYKLRESPVFKVSPLSILARLIGTPRRSVAKGLVALRLSLADRPLRRLLFAYLVDRQARRTVGLDRVLDDLLRLSIVRHAMGYKVPEEAGFRVGLAYHADQAILVFRSMPVDHGADGGGGQLEFAPAMEAALPQKPLRQIVWDHSAIAKTVPCLVRCFTPLSIAVGPNGVYEFTALAAFASLYPERTWQALVPFLPALNGNRG